MIKITELAKEKIKNVLYDEGATLIRFGLQGGGCSGMTYYFAIEKEKAEDDIEYQLDERLTLLVDSVSAMYLEDAEIDYKKDLMGETFIFNNPNSKHSCGCGNSVSFG